MTKPSGVNKNSKHFIEMISITLHSFIKGPKKNLIINSKSCSGARLAIDTCNAQCGCAILDARLRWTVPSLGAKVDVTAEVDNLILLPSETLSSFMIKCNKCDQSVRDAGL